MENPAALLKQGIQIRENEKYACRFKYPKDLIGYKHEYEDATGQNQVISESIRQPTVANIGGAEIKQMPDRKTKNKISCLRNHYTINNYVAEILLIWGANMDYSAILNPKQAQEYCTKYMTKNGESSKDHKKLTKSTIAKKNADAPGKKLISSMLMETIPKDVPKEEACLQLLKGRNYMDFSMPFSFVSLKDTKLVRMDKNGKEHAINKSETLADLYFNRTNDENYLKACVEYDKNPDAFLQRAKRMQPNWTNPVGPKEVTLHDFVAFFTRKWNISAVEHCPQFTPFFKSPPSIKNLQRFEIWAKNNMLEFIPGATPETICDPGETIKEAMERFVSQSPHCPSLVKEDFEEALAKDGKRKKKKQKQNKKEKNDNMETHEVIIDLSDDQDSSGWSSDSDVSDVDKYPDLYPNLQGKLI